MSDYGNCNYCGHPADKYSSGIPECWSCWNRRKLDLPAAKHWQKVCKEFLSNVDMYDWSKYFPNAGLSKEDVETTFTSVAKLLEHSEAVIKGEAPKVERIVD